MRDHRSLVAVVAYVPCLLLAATLLVPAAAGAGEIDPKTVPECSFDRVDYAHPEKHLDLCPQFGGEKEIRALAKTLRGAAEEETLANVHGWVGRTFRYEPSRFDHWRDWAAMKEDGSYGGCADYALAFGSLTRACGVPTVWVKTMDADWIRDFVARRREYGNYRGHVFLEVFVGKRWRLLEPGGLTLYDEYATTARLLPGDRWAYDKGGDPWALVLSVRWKEWLVQTERHFEGFDTSVLPVTGGRDLAPLQVLILASGPAWQWTSERCIALGFRPGEVGGTNAEFEKWLPRCRGTRLVITCIGERMLLPEEHRAKYLPWKPEEIRRARAETPAGTLRGTLADGTRVTLLYAPDAESLRPLAESLTLDR